MTNYIFCENDYKLNTCILSSRGILTNTVEQKIQSIMEDRILLLIPKIELIYKEFFIDKKVRKS